MIKAVLFDLDGTLVDSAPDLAAALNRIMVEEGEKPLAFETIRPHVSKGGMALTRLGFEDKVSEEELESLKDRLLITYLENIAVQSALFDGFEHVLKTLEDNKILWGIVTNKAHYLTMPLLQQLNLAQRCATIISGDTTAERKPHPLPVITAAKEINIDCQDCLYVGDDPRDITAGNAAGMTTIIASFGYIYDKSNFASWHADSIIDHPSDLLTYLNL